MRPFHGLRFLSKDQPALRHIGHERVILTKGRALGDLQTGRRFTSVLRGIARVSHEYGIHELEHLRL